MIDMDVDNTSMADVENKDSTEDSHQKTISPNEQEKIKTEVDDNSNDTLVGRGKENKDVGNVKDELIDVVTVDKTSNKVLGKRKVERKSWSKEELNSTTGVKKPKSGLRPDCPTFCKAGCTNIHHDLLVYARRMIENDSSTTMVFLEHVAEYYGGSMDTMSPSDIIDDPWKDTRYPLLHYLALMGKCAGCFALADAGHDPVKVVSENGDTVLHTMVREMYNFNCTHGHMDILLKKFKLLLREFKDCMFLINSERDTPLHVCAQMIANTVKLLSAPGRMKPPFRLYQFLKNVLTAFLEQVSDDDEHKLNMQNICGYTIAHYIALDLAASDLLAMLKEKGADFTIVTVDKKSVLQLQEDAPPAPSNDILELAIFSARSNKYKATTSKKPKFTPTMSCVSPLKKRQSKPPIKLVEEDIRPEPKRAKIKVTKTKSERRASLKITKVKEEEEVDANKLIVKLPIFKNMAKVGVKSVLNTQSSTEENTTAQEIKEELKTMLMDDKKDDKVKIMSMEEPISAMASATLLKSLKNDTYSKPVDSDMTPTMVNTCKTLSPPNTKTTIPLTIPTTIPNKVIQPHQIKLPATIQVTTSKTLDQISVSQSLLFTSLNSPSTPQCVPQKTKLQIQSPASISTISTPSPTNQSAYPKIQNVSSLNNVLFRPNQTQQERVVSPTFRAPFQPRTRLASQTMHQHPHTLPNNVQGIHQHPHSLANNIQGMHQHPHTLPSNVQNMQQHRHTLPNNVQNMQQPFLFKTADGKIMSVNLLQVNNGQASMKPLIPKNPNVPPQSYQRMPLMSTNFVGPNNVRYIYNPRNIQQPQLRMRNTSFNMRPQRNNFSQNDNQQLYSHPMMMNSPPSMVPVNKYSTNFPPTAINPFLPAMPLRYPAAVPTNEFICPPELQNVTKTDEKKFKSLEASIKNLHNSITHVIRPPPPPPIFTMSSKVEAAPPVIILDNDDVEMRDVKNSKLTSPVSSDKITSTSNMDPDNMVLLVKNYLQEKGSISDFIKYSQEKKTSLLQQLKEERQRTVEINDEMINRENELASSRECIIEKEMEIAQLRLKVTNMGSNLQPLRAKRNELVELCSSIEKRIKAVDERTELFQSFAVEKNS